MMRSISMKRQLTIKALSVLGLLFFMAGMPAQQKEPVDLQKIDIQFNRLRTQVILVTDDGMTIAGSRYMESNPPTLAVVLQGVNPSRTPQISQKTSSLFSSIRFRPSGENQAQIDIEVKEKVPYRIFRKNRQTIIELYAIQRTLDRYMSVPAPDAGAGRPKRNIRLTNITVASGSEKVDIITEVTGRVTPQLFALADPLRLVADLYSTVLQGPPFEKKVGSMGIQNVRSAQFERGNRHTITRIVFDIDEPKLFSLDSNDHSLTFSFFKDNAASTAGVQSQPEKNKAPVSVSQPPPLPVSEKEAAVSSKITSKKKSVVQEEKPKKEITPPQMENPSIPKKEATSLSSGSIQNQTQISPLQSQVLGSQEETYSGQLIDFRVKGMDLRDAILTITSIANLNVVFNPNVKGTVTVDLVSIPWDQALDLILKENKMGRVIEGNVLRIVPIDILTKEQEEQRKLAESREMAGPKVTRTFELSYASAKMVESLLKGKVSDRGEIIVDERTNTIIVSDVKERMNLIEQLITVFDKATPQVSIEAKVIEATSNFVRNLGIQWGWKGVADPFYGNQTSLQFPNKILNDGAIIPQGMATRGIAGPLGGYAINLPAPSFSTALGFSFANVLDTFRIDMALSALETSGEGRIVSTPSIVTQNNVQAEIIQGRQIPLQTTANFTVTTRYQNAALELRATPQIAHDGTITLTLDIQNNAADFANLVNGIPPLITQSTKTTVTISDGGTTVIGGIYRTEDSITRERVPFLYKIPILGNLFKSTARKKENRELLIFITPRIIK